MPTRVLDVVSAGDEAIRLHLPSDSDTSEYIALSYRWGRNQPCVTDQYNLGERLNRIELSLLPPTLRDAVLLTRFLGIKYLWIDALCIIQRDQADWVREAAKMNAVYSHALLTISADAAVDTSSSLFKERSVRHEKSVVLPWPLESPDDGGEPLKLHVFPNFINFGDEIRKSPLAKRGWTFQERALSARIVHFGEDMCYWECKEACIGEDEEIGKYSVQDEYFHLRDLLAGGGESDMSKVKLHGKWAWVIAEFSKRELTVEGDAFAALEGVAIGFAEKDKLGKYFCGLWGDEFLRYLLWSSDRTDEGSIHRRSKAYRAPTWSWVAVVGPVKNPAIEIFFEYSRTGIRMTEELGSDGLLSYKTLSIEEVHVETEGPGYFGPVTEAWIKVRGILQPVKYGEQVAKGLYVMQHEVLGAVGIATWDVDDDKLSTSSTLWICPVMQCKKLVEGEVVCECLVLHDPDSTGGRSMTFQRVAKGRARNFWTENAVLQFFTIV
jgi:heterokaryon incompatibility protein (HET)